MKNYTRKITLSVVALALTTNLSAANDYNLLAKAVDYLIKQTQEDSKKIDANMESIDRLNKEIVSLKNENGRLKGSLKQIKNNEIPRIDNVAKANKTELEKKIQENTDKYNKLLAMMKEQSASYDAKMQIMSGEIEKSNTKSVAIVPAPNTEVVSPDKEIICTNSEKIIEVDKMVDAETLKRLKAQEQRLSDFIQAKEAAEKKTK